MPAKRGKSQELFDISKYGNFYVPDEVVKFLVELVQPKSGEKVLSVGFYPESLNLVLGDQVTNKAIGAEILPLNEFEALSKHLFDVILCAPAFGEKLPESNEPSEEMWLKWSVDHLSENGRLAIIVPLGLLSNYSQETIRSFLIEKSGLEAIIEIPSGWAIGTTIQASVLYITTNIQPERPVRIFRFFGANNVPWSILANEARSTKPNLPTSKNVKSFTIPASQLDNTRLDAKYYDPVYNISPPDPTFEVVRLVDLVDIRSGERFSENDLQLQGIPFIKVKNINIDGTLNLHNVTTIKPSAASNSRSYSQSGEILISIAGTVGKVAIVPSQVNVCIDTSLRRLRIKDINRILPEYLAHYLQSNTAKIQIEKASSGSVVEILSTPNLEQIIVYLPDIKKQQELIKTYDFWFRKVNEQLLLDFPNSEQMRSILSSPSEAIEKSKLPVIEHRNLSFEEIVKSEFPFPIARAFTVFEASISESSVSRLKKMINVSESIVYYLYGILVADQLRRIKSNDSDLKLMLRNSINDYSLDKRIKYILYMIKVSQEDRLFTPEIFNVDINICSEIHNKIRNVFSHTDLPEARCKKLVEDYKPKIIKILKSLLPMKFYRLAQVTNVVVRDDRPQHHIMTMVGDNSVFPTQVEDLDNLLLADTQHMIILDEDYNVLDLHPFYVIHAWESTGMRNQLCFLKQITGQDPKQRLKIESTEGAGETHIEMDLQLSKLLQTIAL